VNSAIAVVKQNSSDSRRQFFAAVKKSEFQGLHSKHSVDTAQHNILEMLNTEEKLKDNYSDLDQPISEQEIKNALKKLI
jgi:hypothetical protein